jgi:hypothetical protein
MSDDKNTRKKDDIEPDKKDSSGVEFYHFGEEPPGTPPVMPEEIGEKIFKEPGVAEPLEEEERE